jgi:hypothetical protein
VSEVVTVPYQELLITSTAQELLVVSDTQTLVQPVETQTLLQSAIQGPAGPAGATGAGVPIGGTTGQALIKLSATNYDTAWQALGETLGGYPVVLAGVQITDVLTFRASAWVNTPQIQLSDGGNF